MSLLPVALIFDFADENGKVSYFEGTPIPSSVGLVLVIAVLFLLGKTGDDIWLGAWSIGGLTLHPLTLLFAASGSAMISTFRFPKI